MFEINDKARELLLTEIKGLTDNEINLKPVQGWSIKQVIEHLYLAEASITKIVQDQLEHGKVVNPVDKPVEHIVDRKTKVNAPAFLVPSENVASMDELQEQLGDSHETLARLLEMADEKLLVSKGLKHPGFGMLNLKQWIEFVGYHELRHIEQIKELKMELGIA